MAVFDRGTLHYTLTATEAVLRELPNGPGVSVPRDLPGRTGVCYRLRGGAGGVLARLPISSALTESEGSPIVTDLLETLIRERNAGPLRGRVGNCPTGCRAGKTTGADCRAWRNRPTCGWRRFANLMSENSKGVCTASWSSPRGRFTTAVRNGVLKRVGSKVARGLGIDKHVAATATASAGAEGDVPEAAFMPVPACARPSAGDLMLQESNAARRDGMMNKFRCYS